MRDHLPGDGIIFRLDQRLEGGRHRGCVAGFERLQGPYLGGGDKAGLQQGAGGAESARVQRGLEAVGHGVRAIKRRRGLSKVRDGG